MTSNRVLWAIAAIAILAAIAAVLVMRAVEPDPPGSNEIIRQSHTERVWAPWEFEFEDLSPGLNQFLYRPVTIRVDDDLLYIADFSDLRIKKFNLDGEFVGEIGKGGGEGPGELHYITDFDVLNQDLFIADNRFRGVHHFKTDGTFVSRFHTEGIAFRITAFFEDILVLSLNHAKPHHRFDYDGNLLGATADSLWGLVSNPMGPVGHFARSSGGLVVFVLTYDGYVVYLDDDGSFKQVVETIDRPTLRVLPSETPQDPRVMARAPTMNVMVMQASFDSGSLYLLSYFNEDGDQDAYSVLDRYDLESGLYINSMRLPVPVRTFTVYSGKLYVIRNAGLLVSPIG